MKPKITQVCLVIMLLSSIHTFALPKMKATYHVTDFETGLPVTNAVVRKFFLLQRDWNSTKTDREEVKVDESGFCSISKETMEDSGGGAGAYAESYYYGSAGFSFTGKNIPLNRWEPWNPTIEIKLRPEKNPVPMIYNRIEALDIPALNAHIGFDFEKGDFVAPHGKGKQSDFFVNMYRRFEHSKDLDVVATITFPNKGDGIQLYTVPIEFKSSSYKFPFEASTNGYRSELVLERHATLREKTISFDPKNDKYFFRVRTVLDNDGNIISACYGRIDSAVEIGWGDVLDFTYHFNPVPNERSLEWNGENLLKKR